jgi:hypothetical protein
VIARADRDEDSVVVDLENTLRGRVSRRKLRERMHERVAVHRRQILAHAAIRDRRGSKAAAIEFGDVMT